MPSDISSTYGTNISSDILARIAAGSLEVREQLIYNPKTSTLASTVFLVPAGSPIPTPSSANISATALASYGISVGRTYTSCSPYPSLLFTGTITSSSGGPSAPNGIYNLTLNGTPAAVSIGYTTDTPPAINNVVELFAGLAVSYSAGGSGTIAFPAAVAGSQPTITSVVNGASLLPLAAGGAWVTITGSNLASITDDWSHSITNGALPTKLDGVSVIIDGKPAYVNYISSGQINVVAPDLGSGPVNVAVTNGNATSAPFSVTAAQYAPALFSWPGNQAVATHADFSYAAKNGTFPGVTTVPAKPGETIILWGTGLGTTNPSAPAGVIIPMTPAFNISTLPTVTLNNSPVTVLGASLSAGSAALDQIEIQIPSSMADGDWPVQVSIGGATSPLGVILTVQH